MAEVLTENIRISTAGNSDILDITDAVAEKLRLVKLKNGIVNISVAGSTASITTCEYESGVIADLKQVYEKLIPENKRYEHNFAWNDGNAHSHLRAALTGPSVSISFQDGKLCLGTWQQIVLIDFDNRPRSRNVLLQFIGK